MSLIDDLTVPACAGCKNTDRLRPFEWVPGQTIDARQATLQGTPGRIRRVPAEARFVCTVRGLIVSVSVPDDWTPPDDWDPVR